MESIRGARWSGLSVWRARFLIFLFGALEPRKPARPLAPFSPQFSLPTGCIKIRTPMAAPIAVFMEFRWGDLEHVLSRIAVQPSPRRSSAIRLPDFFRGTCLNQCNLAIAGSPPRAPSWFGLLWGRGEMFGRSNSRLEEHSRVEWVGGGAGRVAECRKVFSLSIGRFFPGGPWGVAVRRGR